MLRRQGTGRGEEDGKEGEKEKKIKKQNTTSSTLTFVIDVCTITPSTITTDILTVF